MRKRKRTTSFKFKAFSRKQKKLLSWWANGSPYRDYDTIICHGSIRSGKTVAMIDSFITWSLTRHRDQNFIVAGKSMGALKRNVLEPMFKILTAKGIDYHYHMSENPHVKIGTNTYYLFGANNESSQDTLQGLTAAGVYLDEVALFPRSFVDQAMVFVPLRQYGRTAVKSFLKNSLTATQKGLITGLNLNISTRPTARRRWCFTLRWMITCHCLKTSRKRSDGRSRASSTCVLSLVYG